MAVVFSKPLLFLQFFSLSSLGSPFICHNTPFNSQHACNNLGSRNVCQPKTITRLLQSTDCFFICNQVSFSPSVHFPVCYSIWFAYLHYLPVQQGHANFPRLENNTFSTNRCVYFQSKYSSLIGRRLSPQQMRPSR